MLTRLCPMSTEKQASCGSRAHIVCFFVACCVLCEGMDPLWSAACCLIRSQCFLLTAFVPLQSWLRQDGEHCCHWWENCWHDFDKCIGFTSGSATPCMMQLTAGLCSVDDQSKFSDQDDIAKKAGDSGNSSCERTVVVQSVLCCAVLSGLATCL